MSQDTANTLLSEVLDAHGGLERARGYTTLAADVVGGGRLWGIKGITMDSTPRRFITELRRQHVMLTPFGDPDWTMTWTPARVVIASNAGAVIAERDNPRDAFAGHVHDTPWDPLHLGYFNGYAMWTYHALPFVLAEPSYELETIPDVVQDGLRLRGLKVRFPADVHTHTREQRLYFDKDGLLRRQDYEVDVWAGSPAVHLLFDYVEVGGLKLASRRSVYRRNADSTPDYNFNTVTIASSNFAPQ